VKPTDFERRYRAAVRSVLQLAHHRSDSENQAARAFRNRILLASAGSVLGAAAVVITQHRIPGLAIVPPPSGGPDLPAWGLLVFVMVSGCIGALVTAIPAISVIPTDFTPFNLPLHQAVLKITFGAITAVLGVVTISSVTAITGLRVDLTQMSVQGLFLLAAVFGAGQQAVTGFFDKRAGTLLDPPAPKP
jgi:hypothetical protein